MKRLAALASALLLCGCACDGAQPPAPTVLPTAAVAAQDDADPLARAAGAYELTGGEDSLGSGGCDSFFADENAVLVLGGALSGTGATIDKTGDTADVEAALRYGCHAAVAVRRGGSVTLSDALLTTNGAGACGVFAAGEGTAAALHGGLLSTAGGDSPGAAAVDGASVSLDDAEVLTDGTGSPCLYARDGGTLAAAGARCKATASAFLSLEGGGASLTNCAMSGGGAALSDGASLTVEGGSLTGEAGEALFLTAGDAEASLTGVTLETPQGGALLCASGGAFTLRCSYQALAGALSFGEGGSLLLVLQNNSSFTGSLPVEARLPVTLTLDGTSRWFVTGDSRLMALTEGEDALSCIESNGFTVYYDAGRAENAWLGGAEHPLPGGGVLKPLS